MADGRVGGEVGGWGYYSGAHQSDLGTAVEPSEFVFYQSGRQKEDPVCSAVVISKNAALQRGCVPS